MLTLTAKVHFAAVHLTGPTGTEVFNLVRLRRAIELLAEPRTYSQALGALAHEYPGMPEVEAYQYVMAARKCINHGVEI